MINSTTAGIMPTLFVQKVFPVNLMQNLWKKCPFPGSVDIHPLPILINFTEFKIVLLVYVGYFTLRSLLDIFFSNYCDYFSAIVKPPSPQHLCLHISGVPTPEKQHPDTNHLCVTIPRQICRFSTIKKTCSNQSMYISVR